MADASFRLDRSLVVVATTGGSKACRSRSNKGLGWTQIDNGVAVSTKLYFGFACGFGTAATSPHVVARRSAPT